MNVLKDILNRCHERNKNPLRQRRTKIIPDSHNKAYPHQHTIYCARNYPVSLVDIEEAGISFMPIGKELRNKLSQDLFEKEHFFKRQGIRNWSMARWDKSWGINIFTGAPSGYNGANWHDIVFTYEGISTYFDAVLCCVEALVNFTVNPLLTLTITGGLRFTCRVQDYLHPNSARQYIYKDTPASDNTHQRIVFLKMLGKEGVSCWDARYELLSGNILDPPVIAKELLFAPINALRSELHQPISNDAVEPVVELNNVFSSLDSYILKLAKQSFLERGFSYIGKENNASLWVRNKDKMNDGHIALWEKDYTIWVCASTQNFGIPTTAIPITEVWDDTGILPQIPANGLPISDEMLKVQEEKLSPLAIKRPKPILQKSEQTNSVEKTTKQIITQLQKFFEQKKRILTLITDHYLEDNLDLVSDLLPKHATCINPSTNELAIALEMQYKHQNAPSVVHWKPRLYLWEKVKDIPIKDRLENPFQHGNVCEDAERCESFEKKGGNATESICPQCPVFTKCQNRGYLSQFGKLQQAKTVISSIPQLFFNPQYAEVVRTMIEQVNRTDRLCILDGKFYNKLFLECELTKEQLEEWIVNWHGDVLADFAKVILNTLEIKSTPEADVTRRMRSVIQAFEWKEKTIVEQMCQISVAARIEPQGCIDPNTSEELARFTIKFENGCSAYIPLNSKAADRMTEMGFTSFQLQSLHPNKNVKIQMSLTQAIEMGILNTETVENIERFPSVCQNPEWTFWHQIKRFFDYYSVHNNPPFEWNGKILKFQVPPILHKDIKHLLLISATNFEKHFSRAFFDEEIQVFHSKRTTWKQGNDAFQIRTGTFPRIKMLDLDTNWKQNGLSNIGQHILLAILAEIEKVPNVKHAILTHNTVIRHLRRVNQKENVCFVSGFGQLEKYKASFNEADVIWLVGTPEVGPYTIWSRAQYLFGNDEKPIRLERDVETGFYIDERVQSIYEEEVIHLLTQMIRNIGLDRISNKKVVLISSIEMPNITNRSETLLFDWEDFEIAGGLDKLIETIRTRQRFETERENITTETSSKEVQRILGCSVRQANRILKNIRGRNILRAPYRDEILSLLAEGEKKTAELVAALDGTPQAINYALSRLIDKGEIIRVQRGVYVLPKSYTISN